MIRVPEDGQLVLDPFDRLARPLRESVAVAVLEYREEVAQTMDDVFRLAGGDEHRDDGPALVAHDEPVVPEAHFVDLPVAFGEGLSDERGDRRDHASDDVAVLVRHQAPGHVLDEQPVRPDEEDLLDHRFRRHVDDDLRKEGFDNRVLLDSPEGYIPGRNLIFYALAGYYAELDGVRYIVGGHNGIDPESFPDSSPKFFNFLNSVFHLSLWSYEKAPVQILVPLSGKSKEEVVRMGLAMGVPFEVTWSCYWDRAVHCGTCASCQERREAFAKVGVEDPVPYEA